MLPKKIDKKYMGSHDPRLAFLPCKERVESSILFGSTNIKVLYKAFVAQLVRATDCLFIGSSSWKHAR